MGVQRSDCVSFLENDIVVLLDIEQSSKEVSRVRVWCRWEYREVTVSFLGMI